MSLVGLSGINVELSGVSVPLVELSGVSVELSGSSEVLAHGVGSAKKKIKKMKLYFFMQVSCLNMPSISIKSINSC